MKYFSATYTDSIKFNKKPNEDFYLVSSKKPIFIIADGVTQSLFQSGKYAFPAGARAAAQIFCNTILDYLENKLSEKNIRKDYQNLIKKSFDLANKRIKQLNISEGIDKKMNYLDYDWFDTVGITGFICDNILYYGYVGDCGLAIFDKNDKLRFQTKDMVTPARQNAKNTYKNWETLSIKQRTIIMHKEFRNNLNNKGYGSFTGEKGVKTYYQINNSKLNEEDLIIFYSDGFSNHLKLPKFIKILRKQDEKVLNKFIDNKAKINPSQYGSDRTLITTIYKKTKTRIPISI